MMQVAVLLLTLAAMIDSAPTTRFRKQYYPSGYYSGGYAPSYGSYSGYDTYDPYYESNNYYFNNRGRPYSFPSWNFRAPANPFRIAAAQVSSVDVPFTYMSSVFVSNRQLL